MTNEQYLQEYQYTINENCKAIVGETEHGVIHIRVETFSGEKHVVVTSETLDEIFEAFQDYKENRRPKGRK